MPSAVKKRSTRAPAMEKITLLAVCSSDDDLRLLADSLEAERWTVRHAQTCGEALQAMESENPAVVACEHELADGTWRDLFALASTLQDPPPVVVVSRHADENLWAEVLNLGGYDVLSKPFEKNEVTRVFEMASRHGRTLAAG